MANDERDPREAVLHREYLMGPPDAAYLLARLNDADPLRAMLPEVVEFIGELADKIERDAQARYPYHKRENSLVGRRFYRDTVIVERARALLTRLREISPEGGE